MKQAHRLGYSISQVCPWQRDVLMLVILNASCHFNLGVVVIQHRATPTTNIMDVGFGTASSDCRPYWSGIPRMERTR